MEHQRKLFQQRGYSEDLLPKTQSQRAASASCKKWA